MDGEKVDAEVPFLAQIEDAWRDDIAADRVSVADGSHCWLARHPKSKEFGREAWCGPVRHLGANQPGVWDVYGFNATVSDQEVSVSDVRSKDIGAGFPADREPYRPDDAVFPENPEALAAPKPPPVEKGYTARLDASQIGEVKDRGQPASGRARIIAPDLEVVVDSVGRLETLPGGAAGIQGPPDGEELRVITLTFKQARQSWDSERVDTTPTFAVDGPAGRKVLELNDEGFGTGRLPTEAVTIVASIPTGHDAQLVVGVAGVEQTLSVRTGERMSKTAAAYYRATTTVGINRQFPSTVVTVGDFAVRHSVSFTTAGIVPFVPTFGWANPGKVWLQLHIANASFGTEARSWQYQRPTVAASKSITIVDDRGRRVAYTGDLPTVNSYLSDASLAVQIPANAKRVTVTYGPTGTFSAGTWDHLKPHSGTFRFKPIVFAVPIPQA